MNNLEFRIIDFKDTENSSKISLSAIIVDNPSYDGIIFDFDDITFIVDKEHGMQIYYTASQKSIVEIPEERHSELADVSSRLFESILNSFVEMRPPE